MFHCGFKAHPYLNPPLEEEEVTLSFKERGRVRVGNRYIQINEVFQMIRAGNNTLNPSKNITGHQCPFINRILTDCHCSDMRSVKIEEAIYYCGANYDKCNIYKSLKKKNNIPSLIIDSLQKEDLI